MNEIFNLLNLLRTQCQNINMKLYNDSSITHAITDSISKHFKNIKHLPWEDYCSRVMEIQRLIKQIPAFMVPKRRGGSKEG